MTCNEVHSPSIEATVFDTDFAIARLDRDSLTLSPDKSRIFQRDFTLTISTPDSSPHSTDDVDRCWRILNRNLFNTVAGFNLQVAETGFPLPRPQPDLSFKKRMLIVLVLKLNLTIDGDCDRSTLQLNRQRNPFVDGNRTRNRCDRFPVLSMAAQQQRTVVGV